MVQYRRLKFLNCPDYKVGTDGSVWSKKKNGHWKRMKHSIHPSGHHQVSMVGNRGTITRKVHQLVLLAFVGKPKPGQECCHYPDEDPSNNKVENLSWGTRERNMKHRRIHGKDNSGERNGQAALSNKQVRKFRRLYRTGNYTQKELAERFSVSQATACNIVHNKTYKKSRIKKKKESK